MRLVLDTNIVLDLFVFRDAAAADRRWCTSSSDRAVDRSTSAVSRRPMIGCM